MIRSPSVIRSASLRARPARRRWTHDQRIVWLVVLSGLPAIGAVMILLWRSGLDPKLQLTIALMITVIWLGGAFAVRERVVRPLQTASNLLSALREEDFSIRARGARRDDPLGEVLLEVNALRDTLREQRLDALEAGALVRTVLEEIDVAIFAFDRQ